MKSNSKSTLPRRHFLQQLLLLGGAAGTTALALQAVHAEAKPRQKAQASSDSAKSSKGYRLTDHIRTYYEKAQI